jgi:predicted lipoprotein with Yx(FWY)xxD motif
MTLYFFTNDTTPGVSACEGDCLEAWPPLTVPAGNTAAAGDGVTGVVGLVPREDGSLWVTYDGRPLYYFAEDTEAGQTNGQGRGDVWYVAQVDGSVPEAGS